MVDALVRAFPSTREPDNPRDHSAMAVFTASDGCPSLAPLTFGEIADVLADAGFVLVPEEMP